VAKRVLITGASSGIGKASAAYFCDAGLECRGDDARVRQRPRSRSAAQRRRQPTGRPSDESVRAAIGAAIARFGTIDGLVNNADDPNLDSYSEYAADIAGAYAKVSAARSISAHDVPKVIFEAATDTTDRLRYLVGNDSRGFIAARYEKSEPDYIRFMRNRFA
jgi:NAD(P)-dependent dehydrogenase (short-subunit alcohol dehydrogenase family)